MSRKIFVNLPVADLPASERFFRSLGFAFNQQFCDATALCMVISDDIYIMLLSQEKFREFAPKAMADARQTTEVLLCLSCDSREEVDERVRLAVAGGGTVYKKAMDYGFMYGHGFQDLDGHVWELMYMEPAADELQALQPASD